MKKKVAMLLAALGCVWLVAGASAQQSAPEKWIHVRVESLDGKGDFVRVNLPLSLAEKLAPAVHDRRLRDGRVRLGENDVNGVDVRALLDAVRTARDGEFVTVQSKDGELRVAKENGYLNIHIRDDKKEKKRTEIRVPMAVVDVLAGSSSNELDVAAALRALGTLGDTEILTLKDEKSSVRIWLDTKNTAD